MTYTTSFAYSVLYFLKHDFFACSNILFRLDGELLFFACPKKSNQKKRHPRPVCPSGSRGIRLCLRAALTRRPGSTRLNRASMPDLPYQSRIPRQTLRGRVGSPLSSPKTALLVGSIDQGRSIESRRARMASRDDPLAVKMAEGMRTTSAWGRRSFGYFSVAVDRKVTRSSRGETSA